MLPQDQLPSIQNELEPWLRSFDHIADSKQFTEISNRIKSHIEKRFPSARCRLALSQAGTKIQAYIISKDGNKKKVEWTLKPMTGVSICNILLNGLCILFMDLRINLTRRKRNGKIITAKKLVYEYLSFLQENSCINSKEIVRRLARFLSDVDRDKNGLFLRFAKAVSKEYNDLGPGEVFYESSNVYTFMAVIDHENKKVIIPYWEDEARKQIVLTIEEMAREVISRQLYWVYYGQVPYPE